MKFQTIICGAVLATSLVGCATSPSRDLLAPTQQDAAAFEKFTLKEKPSANDVFVYVGNLTFEERKRVRSVYVKVGDQAGVVGPDRYTLFRLKPQRANASFQSSCGQLSGAELKTLVEQRKPEGLVRDLQENHFAGPGEVSKTTSKPGAIDLEGGKTYFFLTGGMCILNRYAGEITMHGGMNLLTEDRGRYMVFKTMKDSE